MHTTIQPADHRAATSELSMLVCTLGTERYALDTAEVADVQRADGLRHSDADDGSVGTLGDIPVYSLAELFGRPRTGVETGYIVLLHGAVPVGLLVERVSKLVRVDPESLALVSATPGGLIPTGVRGVLRHDDELLVLLSPRHLFSAEPDQSNEKAAFVDDEAPVRRAGDQLLLIPPTEPPATGRPLVVGVSLAQVCEILELPPVVSLPNAPGHLRGLTIWRGRAVPVFDLALWFGLPPLTTERQRLVVVRIPGRAGPVGLTAHPALRVQRLPVDSFPCPTPPIPAELLLAAVELQRETLVIPNLQTLLTGDDSFG